MSEKRPFDPKLDETAPCPSCDSDQTGIMLRAVRLRADGGDGPVDDQRTEQVGVADPTRTGDQPDHLWLCHATSIGGR